MSSKKKNEEKNPKKISSLTKVTIKRSRSFQISLKSIKFESSYDLLMTNTLLELFVDLSKIHVYLQFPVSILLSLILQNYKHFNRFFISTILKVNKKRKKPK